MYKAVIRSVNQLVNKKPVGFCLNINIINGPVIECMNILHFRECMKITQYLNHIT